MMSADCISAGGSMVEKRATPRQRVLKSGTIEFGGGVIDCTVRNVSKNGAALDVATPVGIPATFTFCNTERRIAFRLPRALAQGKPDRC
jgi:hypothetical protein